MALLAGFIGMSDALMRLKAQRRQDAFLRRLRGAPLRGL
jgi:hypothetical protein